MEQLSQFFSFNDLRVIIPELELAFFGMFLLIADLYIKEKDTIGSFALIGVAGSALSLYLLSVEDKFAILHPAKFFEEVFGRRPAMPYGGAITVDGLALFFKLIFLLAAAGAILLAMKFLTIERENHGEFYALILFATMGMMFMAGALDLVTLYIGLETMAIATYILVGFLRSNEQSNEASMKYFLLGAFSSGILLYGFSLLYGMTGSTRIVDIFHAIGERPQTDALVIMAIITTTAGMLFKIAAVPFHQWTPDAYQGAPSPVTAYMSVAVKAASIAMMMRFIINWAELTGTPFSAPWIKIFTVVSAATMTLGNIAAIRQTNIKRLLAYSSISHAGYLLLGFVALNPFGMTGVLLYLLIYTFANLGAWAIVVALRRKNIIAEHIDEMNGLFFRHPAASILMLVFLLSLAGIPPTAGFLGKYYLFSGLIGSNQNHSLLAVIAVLNAAISVYYYLKIVVAMFMKEPNEKTGLALSPGIIATLAVAFIFTLGAGIYPEPIIALAERALHIR